jgi:hypothetical protein
MFDQSTSTFEILNLSIPYFNGTTNYVAKYTPTGNVLGLSQIFDNGTNVGIGTNNPTTKLTISANTLSNDILNISNTQFPGIGTKIDRLGNLVVEGPLGTGYSQILIKNSGGNLSNLTIDSNLNSSISLTRGNQNRYNIVANNVDIVDETLYVPFRTFLDSSHRILSRTGNTEIMYLDATINNSKVGIGTVTPNKKLTVTTSNTGDGIVLKSSAYDLAALQLDPGIPATPYKRGYLALYNENSIYANVVFNTPYHTQSDYINTGLNLGIGHTFTTGIGATAKLQIVGTDSTSSNYSLKIDNSASSPLFYVRNDGNVGIGISTPNARLDILGDITGNLLKINNNNFLFSDKLRIENNGSFHSGSINAFGGFGVGDFTTNHLNYNLNTSFSTYLAFTNNGNLNNISSYGIIGGGLLSADTNFKLTILNNDNSFSNGIKILSTGSVAANDGFNYYNYGLNILNNGTQTNSGSGIYHKIGLNVDVNNGDINYAALFNGGNVGIGTSTPSEKLEVNGNIKTAQPSANGAGAWKLGKKVTATVSLVTTDYIEVEIDSVVYKLALVS